MLAPPDFGAYAIVFAIYFFSTSLVRSGTGEILIYTGSGGESRQVERLRASVSATLIAGIALSVPILAIGILTLTTAVGANLVVLGVALPGIVLQDVNRYNALSQGEPGRALRLTLTVALGQLTLLGLAVVLRGGVSWIPLAAVLLPLCLQGLFLVTWRGLVRLRPAQDWWLEHKSAIRSFAGEFVISSGVSTLLFPVAGPVVGLAAVGQLRGGQIMLGPMNVITGALPSILGPALARTDHRDGRRRRRLVLGLVGATGGLVLLWTIMLLVAPEALFEWLLGETGADVRPLLPGLTGTLLAGLLLFGASSYLRVQGRAFAAVKLRAGIAVLSVSASLAGGIAGGAVGMASVGGFVALCASAVALAWVLLRRRESDCDRTLESNGAEVGNGRIHGSA